MCMAAAFSARLGWIGQEDVVDEGKDASPPAVKATDKMKPPALVIEVQVDTIDLVTPVSAPSGEHYAFTPSPKAETPTETETSAEEVNAEPEPEEELEDGELDLR